MKALKTYAASKKLNAVLKVIAAECIDDLPETVVDSAVRQLDRVIASASGRVVAQAEALLDRLCA